jgi:hypothetical protein
LLNAISSADIKCFTNISLGIIAEYLWRTFDAAKGRAAFIIDEIIDLKNE